MTPGAGLLSFLEAIETLQAEDRAGMLQAGGGFIHTR